MAVNPVSLIVAALAAGAAAVTQNTAADAVRDSYARLKDLVHRRLAGKPAGEVALGRHAEKPEEWARALEAELLEVGAEADPAVIEAAQRLMSLLDPAASGSGKYIVNLHGSQGVQVGDRNTQSNTFSPIGQNHLRNKS